LTGNYISPSMVGLCGNPALLENVMKLSQLHTGYLLQMVQTMYKYETALVNMPDLLTDDEIMCFYDAYLCGGEL
jgi:hypothetical protein